MPPKIAKIDTIEGLIEDALTWGWSMRGSVRGAAVRLIALIGVTYSPSIMEV